MMFMSSDGTGIVLADVFVLGGPYMEIGFAFLFVIDALDSLVGC